MIDILLARFGRPIAAALVLLVASQMSEAAVLPTQEPQQTAPTQQTQPATQPANPSADLPQAPAAAGQQPAQDDQASPGFASRSQDGQPQDSQKPVGTAAGPVTRPSGVAGSRPSGAVIAPSKQRRVRALFIRYGLIIAGVGAAAAVYGLSSASPSRPQ
jgi:hypothetical protein